MISNSNSYVQLYKINNLQTKNKPRALDSIYLGPMQNNNQG